MCGDPFITDRMLPQPLALMLALPPAPPPPPPPDWAATLSAGKKAGRAHHAIEIACAIEQHLDLRCSDDSHDDPESSRQGRLQLAAAALPKLRVLAELSPDSSCYSAL